MSKPKMPKLVVIRPSCTLVVDEKEYKIGDSVDEWTKAQKADHARYIGDPKQLPKEMVEGFRGGPPKPCDCGKPPEECECD